MPTIDTSSPSRNSTPQRTAIRPQTEASQRGMEEEGGEDILPALHASAYDASAINAAAKVACCCIIGRVRTRKDDPLVGAWRDLLDSHARTHGALERALKPHDLGVSEFEVLERLAAVGDGEQRRMQELGKALH